jgi:hypothetical protein
MSLLKKYDISALQHDAAVAAYFGTHYVSVSVESKLWYLLFAEITAQVERKGSRGMR